MASLFPPPNKYSNRAVISYVPYLHIQKTNRPPSVPENIYSNRTIKNIAIHCMASTAHNWSLPKGQGAYH